MRYLAKTIDDLESATRNLSLALPDISISSNLDNAAKQLDDRVTLFTKQVAQLRLIGLIKQMFAYFDKHNADLAAGGGFTANFEVGPQYNDEGYDLRVSYEGTNLSLHEPVSRQVSNEIEDTFSDFYAEHLKVSDFDGILDQPPSLSLSQILTLKVDNAARLKALLCSEGTTIGQVLSQIEVSCSCQDAYY